MYYLARILVKLKLAPVLRPYAATGTSNNDIIIVTVKLLTIDTSVCPTNAINVRDISNEIRKRRLNIVIVLHV